MVLFAVVLVCWVLLTLPAAVLMGKCIARGLEPLPEAEVHVPEQRRAADDRTSQVSAQASRSHA